MPMPFFMTPKSKTAGWTLTALAAVSVACAAVYVLRIFETRSALLSFTNLPAAAEVTASLETQKGLRDLSVKDGHIAPSHSLNAPYKLNTSIKLSNDRYRDFSFYVSDNSMDVLTDGFFAGDPVSIDVDGKTVFENVPSDWSGKLELRTALSSNSAARVCVQVKGRLETIGLCHALPERRAS